MRIRIFEATPETATFVAKVEDRVVGVLSIVDDSPELGLPSDLAFRDELDALRAEGLMLGEVTNQAVAAEYRKSAVPTELMRCAIAHGIKGKYDAAIASVSPSHNGFYELLGFRERGSERSYSDKLHDPVISLVMDMQQWRQPAQDLNDAERFVLRFLTEENPYLEEVECWSDRAREQFFNPELLERLFMTERGFLAECSPEQRKVLEQRWGRELFSAVTGGLFIPSTDQMVESILTSAHASRS